MEFETAAERLGNGTCVVSVAGEVDLSTGTELEETLLAVLDDGTTAVVEICPSRAAGSNGDGHG